MKRFQEAINEQEQARSVDSFSPLINATLAKAFYYARQSNQARETQKLDPKYRPASLFLERAYRHNGMPDLAVNARIAAADAEEAQTIKRAYHEIGMTGVLRAEAESYQRS